MSQNPSSSTSVFVSPTSLLDFQAAWKEHLRLGSLKSSSSSSPTQPCWTLLKETEEENAPATTSATTTTATTTKKRKLPPEEAQILHPFPVQRVTHDGRRTGVALYDGQEEEDPWDCSDLFIPPMHQKVAGVVQHYVEQWEKLDQRKVVVSSSSSSKTGGHDPSHKKEKLPFWYHQHVRLPYGFDWTGKQPPPPVQSAGEGEAVVADEEMVMPLTPGETNQPYALELWKLFRSIPTIDQIATELDQGRPNKKNQYDPERDNDFQDIEQEANDESDETNRDASSPSVHSMPNTRKLLEEIKTAFQENPRLDGHALSRCRLNDRHEMPFALSSPSYHHGHDRMIDRISGHETAITTIRFEAWRRQLQRGSGSDPNRLVVEILGSHTLLDLHRVLVESAQDEFWHTRVFSAQIAKSSQEPAETVTKSQGFFLLEDCFYVMRDPTVDYVGPIQAWLQLGSKTDQRRRARHLGLPDPEGPLKVKAMDQVRLEALSLRLGIRYVHVHHGDVECALFVTDRRYLPMARNELLMMQQLYPLLHDVWTPSAASSPDCQACARLSAVMVTATTTPGMGHVALCANCLGQLRPPGNSPTGEKMVEEYSIWRHQADLSAGAQSSGPF